MACLKVNRSGYEQAKRLAGGSDRKLAGVVKVDPASLSRILSGRMEPTSRLVAGVVSAFGANWLPIFFEVVDE